MTQPNIIFILIDDMGWRDLGGYGSAFYETPNLDRLAAEGMRFTDAYASCPVCSPTRASIMSGKYPATVGVTDVPVVLDEVEEPFQEHGWVVRVRRTPQPLASDPQLLEVEVVGVGVHGALAPAAIQ